MMFFKKSKPNENAENPNVEDKKENDSQKSHGKNNVPSAKELTGLKKTDEKTVTKVTSLKFLGELEELIHSRRKLSSDESYVARMYEKGLDKMLQKVGEEASEYIIDSKNQDRERTISEGADLLFHFILSLTAQNLSIQDITDELIQRHVHQTEQQNVQKSVRKENKK